MKKIFTSESVCQGHPDKLCDFIADSVLDECLKKDPYSRSACEVMATRNNIIIAGEITCKSDVNVLKVVKKAVKDSGYNPERFDYSIYLHSQSEDIKNSVDISLEERIEENKLTENTGVQHELGAGDQGTVYGFATDESSSFIPLPLHISHCICRTLDLSRKEKIIRGIHSDGKAQVSVEYENDIPERVSTIVISVQHDENINPDDLRMQIKDKIIDRVFSDLKLNRLLDEKTEIFINPSGRFVVGGPEADCGLTGRKIIVDTYGGAASHGGGAFSGKDATKVDRSGAYMARHIAKTVVCAGLAHKCQVAVSYAIGKAEPVAVNVQSFGTSEYSDELLCKAVKNIFKLKPGEIIDDLKLREPVFSATSVYGHFSNDEFEWEKIRIQEIQALKNFFDDCTCLNC